MKIGKLIEVLQQFHPNADVVLHAPDGDPLLFVMAYANNDNLVWLESEGDWDLKIELDCRFKEAQERGISELDLYTGFLEIGFTVDIVRKYLGDEKADYMEQFCKEHGLI